MPEEDRKVSLKQRLRGFLTGCKEDKDALAAEKAAHEALKQEFNDWLDYVESLLPAPEPAAPAKEPAPAPKQAG